jgi:hypothetical protein
MTKSLLPYEKLNATPLAIRRNASIKSISGLRGPHILHQVTIELTDKRKISVGTARGGEKFEYEVPDGYVPYVMTGCYYHGAPFPTLIGLGLLIKPVNSPEAKAITCPEKLGYMDLHRHFDPIKNIQERFIRIVEIEIKTVTRVL